LKLFCLKTIAEVMTAHRGKTCVLHKWVYLDDGVRHRLLRGGVMRLLEEIAVVVCVTIIICSL
jgi:hypothetical protein